MGLLLSGLPTPPGQCNRSESRSRVRDNESCALTVMFREGSYSGPDGAGESVEMVVVVEVEGAEEVVVGGVVAPVGNQHCVQSPGGEPDA